jgi:hypothetical protein
MVKVVEMQIRTIWSKLVRRKSRDIIAVKGWIRPRKECECSEGRQGQE